MFLKHFIFFQKINVFLGHPILKLGQATIPSRVAAIFPTISITKAELFGDREIDTPRSISVQIDSTDVSFDSHSTPHFAVIGQSRGHDRVVIRPSGGGFPGADGGLEETAARLCLDGDEEVEGAPHGSPENNAVRRQMLK